MAVLFLVLLWLVRFTVGTDISYLDRSLLEKDIAAVFNKVAYGGITTTKRSISSKQFPPSGAPTTVAPPFSSISVPTIHHKSSTHPTPHFTNPSHDLLSHSPSRSNSKHNSTGPPLIVPKISSPTSFTTPTTREIPSYNPPGRTFFTPPLPPEYANPFADKPTLRGSSSDSGGGSLGRRPIPPPPLRPPSGKDRIPLRPPDLAGNVEKEVSSPGDRKKPLNTPSFNRSPETPYSEIDNTSPHARPVNETDYDFVPMFQYPSVSRILSGSSGRKQVVPELMSKPDVQSKVSRLPEMYPNMEKDSNLPWPPKKEVAQIIPNREVDAPKLRKPSTPELREVSTNVDKIDLIVDEQGIQTDHLPDLHQQAPKEDDSSVHVAISPSTPAHKGYNRDKWGLARDIHVYLTGTLFTILSLYSIFNIVRVNSCKRLLSRGYYISLHGLLFVIGILRSVYLFYDAYNVNKSFPEPVSQLMLNVVSPCITSAFLVLFLFLLQAAKVHVLNINFQRPAFVALFIVIHIIICISLDLATGIAPDTTFLPLIGQFLFVVVCVTLGFSYLYVYRVLAKSAARKQENVFGSAFTNLHRPSLASAVRTTLATALLCLLMTAVQLYGMFGVYVGIDWENSSQSHHWLVWGHQFSMRVIEISMCFLLLWAGVQPLRQDNTEEEKDSQNSGFALFRCRQCTNTPQNSETADDIYPAVCVTNQAIHDYTVRTGKKVYDDSFPLNNLHSGFPLPEASLSVSTSERRLLRKSGYPQHDSFSASETNTSERRSMKKSCASNAEKPEFDLPFSTASEIRHSLKNSGTLILLNLDRPESTSFPSSSSMERHSLKKSSMLDSGYTVSGNPDARRSLKKSGTLVSLNSERRTPVSQHKGGAQTLSTTRERVSPSMLVAENGFVRFRTLADPEEQEPNEVFYR